MQEEKVKECRRCHEVKPVSEFSIKRANKDGYDTYCKNCNRLKAQYYRDNFPERIKENSKRTREKNREILRERNREYYHRHKHDPKYMEYAQKNRENNKEKEKLRRKENREKLNKYKTNCVKCGETRKYLIQFHHIDPNTKCFDIGARADGLHKEEFISELKKCVCLCSNCHDEFHHFYGKKPNDSAKALKEYLSGEINI